MIRPGLLPRRGAIMKITQENKTSTNYTPQLHLAYLKKGRDTMMPAASYKFSYFDNDLSFYFAATSFFQETQIQYTYRLKRSGDTAWSEPSPNAFISFVNLAPGNYILQTRVSFPAGRYADQMIEIPVNYFTSMVENKMVHFPGPHCYYCCSHCRRENICAAANLPNNGSLLKSSRQLKKKERASPPTCMTILVQGYHE